MSKVSRIVTGKSENATSAFQDWLTGLPNQRRLWQNLRREVRRARESDYCFAVLFIDVDRFKAVNDCHGHLVGDKVLRAVARQIGACVRPVDDVFRYGGDEFIVVMKDVRDLEDVCPLAQQLGRELIAKGTSFEGNKWQACVTKSVGVAIVEGTGCSSAEVIDRADRAMYQAKALGRNGRFLIDKPRANRSERYRAEGSAVANSI
jgi:diguanylate cyclase (GGDEF)-like protein